MIDGAGPFRILRSIIVPQSVAAIMAVTPVPLLLRLERLLRPAAVPRQQARAAAAVDRDPAVQRAVRVPADADPGVRADDDGRADRRLPARPAGVHARRRGHRGRQVSATDVDAEAAQPAPRRHRGGLARDPGRRLAARPSACRARTSAAPRVDLPMIDDGEWAGRPDRRPRHREHRADRTAATSRAGTSRSAGTASSRSPPTGSPCSSGGRTARRGDRPVRAPPGRRRLPAWGWDLPVGGGTYHALFPRAWQTFEPEALGRPARRRAAVAGHRRRPRAERAAGRGVRVVGREPGARPADGRAPAHLGRPARRPGRRHRRPAGRTTRSSATDDGVIAASASAMRRRGAPDRRCAARWPSPPWPATAWTLTARARVRSRSPTPSCGRTSPPTAGSTRRPPAVPRPPTAGPAGAAVAATTIARARRAAVGPVRARLGPADRRVRRRAGAGGSATRGLGPDRAAGAGTWRAHALAEAPAWRAAIEALAGADPRRPGSTRLVPGGAVQRAVLPRRRRDVLGGRRGRRPRARAGRPGRFALLECLDYPFYDTVDVDFYASFAMLELFPELERRGHPRPARDDPRRRPDAS